MKLHKACLFFLSVYDYRFFLKVLFSLMKNEKTLFFFSMIQLVWHHQFHFLSDSSMFLLKSFKNFLKCNLCIAAVYKIFPLRYVLYILPYRKLFMEATSTISLSGSTYGPPDPSFILRSDKKSDISQWNDPKKIKRLSKIGVSSDWILFAFFTVVKSYVTKS